MDCKERAPVMFYIKPHPDTGNMKRVNDFSLDPKVPKDCQQTSNAAYGKGYDRGHQVPINYLDTSINSMHESNYMTNVLPQTVSLNRTGWLRTEMIGECLRDVANIEIYGGVIWGNDAKNDLFIKSHGIRTPDKFFKIIYDNTNKRSIAWIFPNSANVGNVIDKYVVSIQDINLATGLGFSDPTGKGLNVKESVSWDIPKGCNRG